MRVSYTYHNVTCVSQHVPQCDMRVSYTCHNVTCVSQHVPPRHAHVSYTYHYAKYLRGDYEGRGVLGFNTLTLVPNQRDCIDTALLDDLEIAYINAYHERVWSTLGPILKERGLKSDYDWLEKECQPITRA
ncbi:hypothetical protein ACJJTC_010700 [Scirpophaga incertulas]